MNRKDNLVEYNRDESIDIFRAFGIILMIMGHIDFGSCFGYFIHAFHMPMFFFVSGLFFSVNINASFYDFVKKKTKTLLLPYAVFGVFHYLIWLIFHWPWVSLEPLKHLLFVNTEDIPIAGALWFLTALFFTEVFYFLIKKYINKVLWQNLIIMVIAIWGCIANSILSFRLPYAMDAAFVGVGLIHIGYLFRRNMDKKVVYRVYNLNFRNWLLLSIITVILIFVNGYISMREGLYAIIPLFWINTVLAIIVGINLAKYILKLMPRAIVQILTSIGRNSIVYLCLNQFIITCISIIIKGNVLPVVITKFVYFVTTMLVLYICALVLTNTKLSILIGK